MATVTIVITDTPEGAVSISTKSEPAFKRDQLSEAQALGLFMTKAGIDKTRELDDGDIDG